MSLIYKNGGYGPHTAIVVSVTSNGINWIEENYVPNTVKTRITTFNEFVMQGKLSLFS